MAIKTVFRDGHGEIEVKKSRFIADLHSISSENEAAEYISGIRKRYRDARHHCYAFVLGANGETRRSSDDGEPSGTAGRPILELLAGEDIHDAVLVVTRYFGGTLLGTGGLIRAYTRAAAAAIDDAVITEQLTGRRLTVICDYSALGRIQSLIAAEDLPALGTRYTDLVETDVMAPSDRAEDIIRQISDITAATARVYVSDPLLYALADGQVILF